VTYAKKFVVVVLAYLSGISLAFATPHIQHWQSASGAQVYFVENHDLPMLDVAVNFPAGSAYDTAEKEGLAGLTHDMLSLGSEGMNEDDISRNLADIGAVMGGDFDADMASISLRTLSSQAERDKALDIMAAVLQHPLFPDAVLAREKNRLIDALKEADTKPEEIADKAFNKAVFGTHPYGFPSSGEVQTVPGIQRPDVEQFYRAHYTAKGAVVAILGYVTRAYG
jgi:zinc protease